MRIRSVKSFKWGTLNDDWDRRGTILTVYPVEVSLQNMVEKDCIEMVQRLSEMITGYDSLDYGTEGEQMDCWILRDYSIKESAIVLRHKYWSKDQTRAFRMMWDALAEVHGWEEIK